MHAVFIHALTISPLLSSWLCITDLRNILLLWCFWIWHLTADTMVTVPSVRHEIVGCKMHQNGYIGFLGHSATSAPDHIFVYEEMLVCKMRWCRPLVIDGNQEIKKRWLLFITSSLPECCTAQQLIKLF